MNIPLLNIIIELFFLSVFFSILYIKRRELDALKLLTAGVFYGVLLEILTLAQLDTYSYGEFFFVIAGAPLWIGTSWGAVIAIAIWTSNKYFKRSGYLPIFDGLFALALDLIFEPIAIYFGFWRWHYHGEGAVLGIPYGNFITWFMVAFLFSFFFRFFKRKRFFENSRYEMFYPLAVITALLSVLILNLFANFGVPEIVEIVGFYTIVVVSPIILFLKCEFRKDINL